MQGLAYPYDTKMETSTAGRTLQLLRAGRAEDTLIREHALIAPRRFHGGNRLQKKKKQQQLRREKESCRLSS